MAKQTNREKALTALLTTSTIKEAAEECGVSVATLYRLLKDATFKREYREAQRELMEATLGKIQRAGESAVDTLKKNLSCGNPAAENAAAKILLESGFNGIHLTDLMARVESIENELIKPQE